MAGDDALKVNGDMIAFGGCAGKRDERGRKGCVEAPGKDLAMGIEEAAPALDSFNAVRAEAIPEVVVELRVDCAAN